jgi:hypothetical protein
MTCHSSIKLTLTKKYKQIAICDKLLGTKRPNASPFQIVFLLETNPRNKFQQPKKDFIITKKRLAKTIVLIMILKTQNPAAVSFKK